MSDPRRRFLDQRYVHYLTFSVDQRRRLLDLDDPKRIVLGVLNHQLEAMCRRSVWGSSSCPLSRTPSDGRLKTAA